MKLSKRFQQLNVKQMDSDKPSNFDEFGSLYCYIANDFPSDFKQLF